MRCVCEVTTIKSLRSVRAFSEVRPRTDRQRVWLSAGNIHCSWSVGEGWDWGGVRVCCL